MAEEVASKEPLPPEELANVDKEVFNNAHVITISEMRILLLSHMNQKRAKNPAYEAPGVMQKTMDYVNKFSVGRNEDAVREVRTVASAYKIKDYELGMLGNLMPEVAEEARTLIPSLADPERFPDDEQLQRCLEEIASYTDYQ